jgi:anthranilate synthase/aminodeoxychorismate synthase-like glutamine amidotransferase
MPDGLPGVVFVDNRDSFTFNLVDEFARRGCAVEVWRSGVRAAHVLARAAAAARPLIVLSPGPGRPADAGCCAEVVRRAGAVPVFGVCLGLQVMVEALGGAVDRAPEPVHGRTSLLTHRGGPFFAGIPSPMRVGRYHSLCAVTVPDALEVLAVGDGVVMAAAHRVRPLFGVQFHPESLLTPDGGALIENVLRWAAAADRRAGS